MTITISPNELEGYANKIRTWGAECLSFILAQPYSEQVDGALVPHWKKLCADFERTHPMPTWKDLL